MSWKNKQNLGLPEIDIPFRRKKVNIFADFETYLHTDNFPLWEYKDDDGFSNILADKCLVIPWLLGAELPNVIHRSHKLIVDFEDYRSFISAKFPHVEFFERLSDYWEAGYLPVIWFHNTSYDLTAAIETAFREIDENLKIYFTTKDNKAFLTGFMESPKYGFKAQFGDTLLYKRISLAEIGNMFNSPKGEIPYTMMDIYIRNDVVHFTDWYTGQIQSVELDYCIRYVKQDVKLLRLYYNQLREETEMITIAINGTPCKAVRTSTQGVHARSLLDIWMHKQVDEKYEHTFKFVVDNEEGKIMQRTLTGGFTSLNKYCYSYICDENHIISRFDCNSMYPYIMTQGLPYKPPTKEKPKDVEYIEWVCLAVRGLKWVGVMECLKTSPIPDNRQTLDFDKPTKIYLMREELNWIKENSEGEWREYYSIFQEKTYIAGNFINYLYDARKNVKEQHEELARQLEKDNPEPDEFNVRLAEITNLKMQEKGIKTTMNSLYGKMCEKSYLYTTVYMDGKFHKILDENAVYRCTLSGAFIALKGRVMVYKQIKKVIEGGFKFLYADTDSVMFAYPKKEENKLNDIFGFNTGKLGQWKNEGSWNEFHSPGKKKKYTLINYNKPEKSEIKLSGILDNPYVNALKNGLRLDPAKTLEDLRYIFNKNNNVLFKNAKNNTVRTDKFNQVVIHPIHVSSNVGVDTTAEIYIKDGNYILEKYE